MSNVRNLPDLITTAQTSEEAFLRQIFVRDQMADWSQSPLIMERIFVIIPDEIPLLLKVSSKTGESKFGSISKKANLLRRA